MVDARARAGARTTLPEGPRDVDAIEGFDAQAPRRSADAKAVIDARELAARERMIGVERAKLLREEVVRCYREQGVNHLEGCKARVRAYLAATRDVGANGGLNFGEHDRGFGQ
ncbi:Complex I subunit NDUFS6 [Ostreococcus tauri]|uniref:Complex I subunit NDUFS6 n=1 Tax=Ostreococcus tauri TaxID=70448 RepID=Q011A1_OSTTA|nr:Complex I subunit NDUFS6 [Ostreococcus tauri]OUS48780.1 putative NADH-ubiquinone oxidoreductase 12 kd subunit [Ostreococcus tauri]CAL55529.1 Complex I subunit NDUFS6 [Ostreococcus tauri]|eukprot:XP_003081360.1 Complex I subunit NDUFS6 [Ostreococcus tauri]